MIVRKAFSVCFTLFLMSLSLLASAQQQNTEKGPVNEFFRSNGKIYVVVGVLVIIFLGVVTFLFRLDRKISKLEQRQQSQS